MAKLLRGDYNECVASCRIIDCRYPYEFEGGHIAGAQNFYTQDQIVEELVNRKTEEITSINNTMSVEDCENSDRDVPAAVKRDILVFHCEFSSERGPKL